LQIKNLKNKNNFLKVKDKYVNPIPVAKRLSNMAVTIDEGKCTGCGSCAEVCPVEAIKVSDKAKVDEDTCIDCGTCVDECPEEAITL